MKASVATIYTTTLMVLMCSISGSSQNANEKKKANHESMTYPVKNISISINRPPAEVYQFASNPENFPRWVAFVKRITRQGDLWVGETDLGVIKIKFTPQNNFGIIDHQVTLANGETVNNPIRVIANNEGCEFVFSLFRMPGRTDAEYNEDANSVKNDLQTLKNIMER
jgi:carbon monoxide dehydrogenase subunit G